jgi:hypothetical protein
MTTKKILSPRTAADRRKGASRFVFDPATGALVVDPNLDLKIRKALTRAARRIAFRQQLRLPVLYFRQLALEIAGKVLLMCSHTARHASYLGLNRGHLPLLLRRKDIATSDGLCQLADNRLRKDCN